MSGAWAGPAPSAAAAPPPPPAVVSVTLSGGVTVRPGVAPPCQSMLASVAVKFNVPVIVKPAALSLHNVTRGATVDPAAIRVKYDPLTRTATWTFPSLVGGSLTDGRYQATLKDEWITDAAGRRMDNDDDGVSGDYGFAVARLFGDADGDGAVTPPDIFSFLAATQSMRGDAAYRTRFDLNADGAITGVDGAAVRARYGTVLDEVAVPAAGNVAAVAPRPVAAAAAVIGPQIKTVTIQARRTNADAWRNYQARTLPAGLVMTGVPTLSKYGGDTSHKLDATGFFRAAKVDGQWWLVDPEGNRYFDNSVTNVGPNVFPDNAADFLAKFGRGRAGNAKWAAWVRAWLRDIGYVSAGPWGQPSIQAVAGRKTNYSLVLDLMGTFALGRKFASFGVGHNGYRNGVIPVFDPAFPAYCATHLTKVLPQQYPGLDPRSDAYLVGYMTDNELPWATCTVDNYLALPATDPNRLAVRRWLDARGSAAPTDDDRAAFRTHVAKTYFRITGAAVRAYDPQHMVLGCRFTAGDGRKSYLLKAARPYTDVASVSYYDDMDPAHAIEPAAAAADLPYIVSEFYAKGADSGMPNTTGYGLTVPTQAARGAYYQQVLMSVLGSAHGVGAAWLTLMDNDLSNPRPELSNVDANKGLMTVHYPLTQSVNPYRPLTDRIRDLNRNLYPLAEYLRAGGR